jgi:hypothetical protein
MKFKVIIGFLAQYYERILAVIVMLAVVVFSGWLMIRVNRLEEEIGREDDVGKGAAAKIEDVEKLRKSLSELFQPLEWSTNSIHRVFIGPYMVAREGNLEEIPPSMLGQGVTKEGFKKEWLKRYRLPTKGNIAESDPDKDGFTVMEEYQANPQTDPVDPTSHPDYAVKLRVSGALIQDPFPFLFTGVSERGGENLFQIVRLDRRGSPYFVQMDGTIPDREFKGFKITHYERKSEKYADPKIKDAEGKPVVRMIDVSELTITKEGLPPVVLIKNCSGLMPELAANLVFLLDAKKAFKVLVNSTFPLQGSQYQVLSIKKLDGGKPSVIIQKLDEEGNPLPEKTFEIQPYTREALPKTPTPANMPAGPLAPPGALPPGGQPPPPPQPSAGFGFTQ